MPEKKYFMRQQFVLNTYNDHIGHFAHFLIKLMEREVTWISKEIII